MQIQCHPQSDTTVSARRLRCAPLCCKATGQLLANLIQHGYNRVRLWDKVKRFSAPFVPWPPAPSGTGHYEGKRRRLLNRMAGIGGRKFCCLQRWPSNRSAVTRPRVYVWAFGYHGLFPSSRTPLSHSQLATGTIQHCNNCSTHLSTASPPAHPPAYPSSIKEYSTAWMMVAAGEPVPMGRCIFDPSLIVPEPSA